MTNEFQKSILSGTSEEEAVRELLKMWRLRAIRATRNYRKAADRYDQLESRFTLINTFSGIVVLALSAVTIAVDNGPKIPRLNLPLIPLMLTFSSAIVLFSSIWQLLRSYGVHSVKTSVLASDYGSIVRQIELKLSTNDISLEALASTKMQLDSIAHRGQVLLYNSWNTSKDLVEINTEIEKVEDAIFKH